MRVFPHWLFLRMFIGMYFEGLNFLPSKIRTAVGKSFTLRAALRAAVMTMGEGTRS